MMATRGFYLLYDAVHEYKSANEGSIGSISSVRDVLLLLQLP